MTEVPNVVPTKKQYALEATKKTIEILQGAAVLVGVPLVKDVLHIELVMIKTCEVGEYQPRRSGG